MLLASLAVGVEAQHTGVARHHQFAVGLDHDAVGCSAGGNRSASAKAEVGAAVTVVAQQAGATGHHNLAIALQRDIVARTGTGGDDTAAAESAVRAAVAVVTQQSAAAGQHNLAIKLQRQTVARTPMAEHDTAVAECGIQTAIAVVAQQGHRENPVQAAARERVTRHQRFAIGLNCNLVAHTTETGHGARRQCC